MSSLKDRNINTNECPQIGILFEYFQKFFKISTLWKNQRATGSEIVTDIEDFACTQESSSSEKVIQTHDFT